ncbi:MAG TPA: glycosyltransferase family 4 protein [Burkholderiales bacterium]|nr:glycosyltransferase family 4 protein [Burkholderiales bacterium]
MKLLRDAGHSVQLITTEMEPGEVLPACMPSGVPVHEVIDARRKLRGRSRVEPLKLVQQVWQIRRIVLRERYDVLHFHGSCNLPNLASLVSCAGVKTPFVATVNDSELPRRWWPLRRLLWRRVSAFITSTEFVRDLLRLRGVSAEVIKHGIVRNIDAELSTPVSRTRYRVLFWRDPSLNNGVDVCLAAFDALASRYPEVSFDAAVRNDHWEDWTPKFKELAKRHPNVNVHVFPYTGGVSLAQLLAESICVVLPFRKLSYHPQLSVLESIQLGIPVIVSALESNVELSGAGRNALLVPVGNVEATVAAIEKVLSNGPWASRFATEASERSRAVWNWQGYLSQLEQTYTHAVAGAAGGLHQTSGCSDG